MKIEAAVLKELGKPLEIMELKTRPLQRGQVLVKIFFSGVCKSQLMEVSGSRGDDKWLPHLLGHEGTGCVIEIGPGVSRFSPGDHVILTWLKRDGIEAECATYDSVNGVVNSGPVTTFSNYSVVSENRLMLKPREVDLDVAVLFGCALPTGAGMVLNQTRLKQDSSLVIIGLGGVGLSALMAAVAMGISEIIAIDKSLAKVEFAKKIGAKKVYLYDDPNLINNLKRAHPKGIDFCIESAGFIETIEFGYSLVRPKGGRLIFASHPPSGQRIAIDPHDLISGKEIQGSWGGGCNSDDDVLKISRLFNNAKMPLRSLIPKSYTLNEINLALLDMKNQNTFRPIIDMRHKSI